MITAAIPLTRDAVTRRPTFGYEGYSSKRTTVHEPLPGFILGLGDPNTTVKPNLVKLVEMYAKGDEPIFVERLCYKSGRDLFPYHAKFITRRPEDDISIVFAGNIEKAISGIIRLPVSTMTPGGYMLQTTCRPHDMRYPYTSEGYDAVSHEYKRAPNLVDCVANANTDWHEVVEALDRVIWDHHGLIHYGNRSYVNPNIYDVLRPTLPVLDPMTMTHFNRSIPSSYYSITGSGTKYSDVSPARPITIPEPDKTVYTQKEYHEVLKLLTEVKLTDVSIGYILSNVSHILDRDIKIMVDRYHRSHLDEKVDFDISSEVGKCDAIIKMAALITWQTLGLPTMYEDVFAVLTITYGDEALIEFYEYETNHIIHACHFDMALAALCSHSVATIPLL